MKSMSLKEISSEDDISMDGLEIIKTRSICAEHICI
jgi:hypothetical protein